MTRPDLAKSLREAQQALGFHTERPPITRQWFDLLAPYLLAPPDQRDALFFALAGEFCALQEAWAKLDEAARVTPPSPSVLDSGSPDISAPASGPGSPETALAAAPEQRS